MNRILVKVVIALSLLYLTPHLYVFAQPQPGKPVARKFDEFGDIYLSDIKARLDNFANQLRNEPNTRAFIIVYRSRRDLPGLNSRLASLMKDYLLNTRQLPADRIVTVDGGVAMCLTQELWIVPVGATPTPRDDAHANQFIDTGSAWKFDEYYYPLPENYVESDEYAGNSLDSFAEALQKYAKSQAYIIAYQQYNSEVRPDPPGTALKMLKAVRGELVNKYKADPAKIKVVNGGSRKLRQIELWIVPRGEHPPVTTPNAFPKRRR